MEKQGAIKQRACEPLPSNVPPGDLNYGLFPSAEKAEAFVEKEHKSGIKDESLNSRPCKEETKTQLDDDYSDNPGCYKNDDGIIINWTYPDSSVAAQLNFYPNKDDEPIPEPKAVEARKKLLF